MKIDRTKEERTVILFSRVGLGQACRPLHANDGEVYIKVQIGVDQYLINLESGRLWCEEQSTIENCELIDAVVVVGRQP